MCEGLPHSLDVHHLYPHPILMMILVLQQTKSHPRQISQCLKPHQPLRTSLLQLQPEVALAWQMSIVLLQIAIQTYDLYERNNISSEKEPNICLFSISLQPKTKNTARWSTMMKIVHSCFPFTIRKIFQNKHLYFAETQRITAQLWRVTDPMGHQRLAAATPMQVY